MMEKFLIQFEEYCKTPGVDSGKAKAYAKAIKYLCDYLDISQIDSQAIGKIETIEESVSDKNSTFYKGLLSFLIKRGQKSYLENGFIKAALKLFFEFKHQSTNIKEQLREFKWIHFYMELADKLLAYKNDRSALIGGIKEVYNRAEMKLPTLDIDNEIFDIDPFSIFALFNKGIKDSNRIQLLEGFKNVFNIESDVPKDFSGIPVVNNMKATFYYFKGERKDADIDNLWKLYEYALDFSASPTNETKEKFISMFDAVIKQKGVSWNITMGLYWVRPYTYINLDARNRKLLENNKGRFSDKFDVVKLLKDIPRGSQYLDIITFVKEIMTEYKYFPELSFDAWKQSTEDKAKFYGKEELVYWPSLEEYNPEITVQMWKDILQDKSLTPNEMLDILAKMLKIGGESTCYHMAEVYGKTHHYYNAMGSNFGKRVKERYNLPDCYDSEYDRIRYYTIPFVGRDISEGDKMHYSWKLRDELKEALEEMDLTTLSVSSNNNEFAKNIILYGPPGTGKTYNTAIYAVAIIENQPLEVISAEAKENYSEVLSRYKEYKKQGKIEFTTFHQSYGYEEFIEGIKPVVTYDSKSDGKKEIQYDVIPGVFKRFCEKINPKTKSFDDAWDELVDKAISQENKYTFTRRTGFTLQAELRDENTFVVIWSGGTSNTLKKERVYEQWISNNYSDKTILRGGKRWMAESLQAIIDELVNKYGLTSTNTIEENSNYVFIIDEINRGNISKILGELITLIEHVKRLGEDEAMEAILPYSNKLFGVPNNVYIIGTMNTADRSIAAIDTALRRRFDFKEMLPQSDVLDGVEVEGISIAYMLNVINKRIEVLYDREHTIGHAYFISLKEDNSIENLANIFKNRIIPLLQEYFYENYERIRLVLGDNQKPEELQFIQKISIDEEALFGEDTDEIEDACKFTINEEAFTNIEAYKKMI